MRFSRFYVGATLLVSLTLATRARADASDLVPEVGYNYGEVETARSAAMGGALRALGNGVTGLYLNPANMALTRVYHLMALAQIWPESRRQTYGAAAVDSVTGRLAGGAGGNYGVLDPDGVDRKWTDARVAIAFPLSDRFYAGITGKYLKLRENGYPRPGFGLPVSYASGGLRAGSDRRWLHIRRRGHGQTRRCSFHRHPRIEPHQRRQRLSTSLARWRRRVRHQRHHRRRPTCWPTSRRSPMPRARAAPPCERCSASSTWPATTIRSDSGTATIRDRARTLFPRGVGYVDPQFSVDVALRRTVGAKDPYGPVTTFVIDLQYFIESTGITRSPGEVPE